MKLILIYMLFNRSIRALSLSLSLSSYKTVLHRATRSSLDVWNRVVVAVLLAYLLRDPFPRFTATTGDINRDSIWKLPGTRFPAKIHIENDGKDSGVPNCISMTMRDRC